MKNTPPDNMQPIAQEPSRTTWESRLLLGGALLLTAAYVNVVVAGFRAPLGYDEAYNAQVALHLATQGRYATDGALYGGQDRLFDAFITTGPTLMVPTAAVVWALGGSVVALRIAPTAGFVLLALVSARLARRWAGTWGAIAAPAALLAVRTAATWPDYSAYGPGDVLGETTCVALLMVAACFLPRTRVAGLILGAAILTKLLAALFLPAFVIACWLTHRAQPVRRRLEHAVLLGVWTAVPVLVWQVIRFAGLGHDYGQRNVEFLRLFASAGSGIIAPDPPGLDTRLSRLLSMAEEPRLTLALAVLAMTALLWLARVTSRQATEGAGPRWARVTPDPPTLALGGGALTLLVWWLFVSSLGFVRHALIAVIILAVVAVAGAVKLCRAPALPHRARVCLAATLAVTLAGSAGVRCVEAWHPTGVSRSEQDAAARAVDETGVRVTRFEGWWQNPELRLLTGLPSRPLDRKGGLLVLDPLGRALDPETSMQAATRCKRTVYDRDGYLICWVARGPMPRESTLASGTPGN